MTIKTLDDASADSDDITLTFSAIAEVTEQTVVIDGSSVTSTSDGEMKVVNSAASSTTTFKITGTAGDDTLSGSLGKDTFSGGVGADSIVAGAGIDSIVGGAGADIIYGQDGADIINGGAGADSIYGGAGSDVITGGADNDDFIFTANTEGTDLIMDWTTGTNQVLFTADDGEPTADVFDAGKVVFAETDPTDTAAAIVALAANDYAEQTGTASVIQDNHVNVFTSSTGHASVLLPSLLLILQMMVWRPPSFFLVFYNTTSTKVELAYVSDAGDTAESFADAVSNTLVQFDDVAATGIADAFGNGNFGVLSLG